MDVTDLVTELQSIEPTQLGYRPGVVRYESSLKTAAKPSGIFVRLPVAIELFAVEFVAEAHLVEQPVMQPIQHACISLAQCKLHGADKFIDFGLHFEFEE